LEHVTPERRVPAKLPYQAMDAKILNGPIMVAEDFLVLMEAHRAKNVQRQT
jgi:hypothetical protein